MADVYGENYKKEFQSFPKELSRGADFNGRVRVLFDEFTGVAGTDVLFMANLPKNARVLDLVALGAGTLVGDDSEWNVVVGDLISADTQVQFTAPADSTATPKLWVLYSQD